MRRDVRATLLSALAVIGFTACTKETPYKYEYKEQVLNKSMIDTDAEYLYVPSYQDVSRNSDLARPYWQGSEKLVKFRFTEHTLQVVEMEKDDRFTGNPRNSKPVFEIPIEHLQYRCAEDRLGECTNREEQNNEVNWTQKSQFKPNFEGIQITELNILPVELDNLFGGGCYSPASSKIVGYEMTDKSLDFQIERVFKVDLACLNQLNNLSDATVSVIYHYSLHKLSEIASPGYQVVDYPAKDEGTFGFFSTEDLRLDIDHRDTEANKTVVMNRWDPDRSEVVYHLSKEFAKPENSGLRAATYKAFDRLNTGLAAAGAKFYLTLKDWSGEQPGDIRNSMIIMVEDPIQSGLLGYGPSVTNPRTGEILSARTVMYPGVMKQFIRRTYEDLRLEREAQKEAKSKSAGGIVFQQPKTAGEAKSQAAEALSRISNEILPSTKAAVPAPTRLATDRASFIPVRGGGTFSAPRIAEIKDALTNYKKNVAPMSRLQDRIEAMSEHCVYPADLFNFDGIVGDNIDDLFSGDLKPWDELDKADKQFVIDKLLPLVWVPTLIHEVGHNLGLRHNFQGSEDKANWYTREELDKMGVKRDIPYSTMMEYSYSDTNNLPTLGKYDIAALRFGYVRQVEKADGTLMSVSGSLGKMDVDSQKVQGKALDLKAYGYCTDEHVGANAGCKRFDEGTTYLEIAQHFINRFYKEGYKRSNFRDGRRSFSLMSDGAYAGRIDNIFTNLRLMFETYERIKNDFGLPENDPIWEQIDFLKDIRAATTLAADFFAEVLRTPDVTCLVAARANPSVAIAAVPLQTLSVRATSCFDESSVQLLPQYMVIAEGGKHFQSKKDPRSGNPYIDQIDVRGIWADKVLALQHLVGRRLGSPSFDRYTENLISFPGVESEIMATIDDLMLDLMAGPVEFRAPTGQTLTIPMRYELFSTHLIPEPLDPAVNKRLNLPETGDTLFAEQIVRILTQELPSTLHIEQARRLMERFEVYQQVPQNGRSVTDYAAVDVGSRRFLALPENALAAKLIENVRAVRLLPQIAEEKLAAIATAVQAGQPAPADATDLEKQAYALKADTIEAYAAGLMKDETYYARILSLLPVAN